MHVFLGVVYSFISYLPSFGCDLCFFNFSLWYWSPGGKHLFSWSFILWRGWPKGIMTTKQGLLTSYKSLSNALYFFNFLFGVAHQIQNKWPVCYNSIEKERRYWYLMNTIIFYVYQHIKGLSLPRKILG